MIRSTACSRVWGWVTSALSPVVPAGDVPRRVVYIAHYDGDATGNPADPFAAADVDGDIVWIRVAHEGRGEGVATLVRR